MPRQDVEYGATDGAGRTHLIDVGDFRPLPLCGYLGDVGDAHEVAPGEYVCPLCRMPERAVEHVTRARGGDVPAADGRPLFTVDPPPGAP